MIQNPFAKYFVIEKRSHHFVITDIRGRAREVIDTFAKHYIQFNFRRVQGRWKREGVKIWASRTRDAREYRFHINQYQKFIAHLESVGLNSTLYDVIEKPYYEAVDAEYIVKPHFKERDYQIPIVQYLSDLRPPIAKFLEIPTGSGKAQPFSSRVLTPSGWIPMSEVTVGTPILGHDGQISHVNAIFPQGVKPVWEITFHDGRKVRACADHQWNIVEDVSGLARNVGTRELENLGQTFYVPLINPQRYAFLDAGPNVVRDTFSIVNADVHETGFYLVAKTHNEITQGREHAQVCADMIDRLQSVGCIAVQVLPGMIKVDTDNPFKLLYVLTTDAYNVHRLDLIRTVPGLRVASVLPVSEEPVQCISVSNHWSTYITDDFVMTHNTFCALKACSLVGKRIVAVLKPTYSDKWVSDFCNIYEMEKEDIWVVDGSKNLKLLLNTALAGKLTHRVIVISSRLLQNWFGDYNEMPQDVYELAGWPCKPDNLFEILGAGVRLIDEAHQEFHLGFMIDLFTHAIMSMSLSATMVSDDQFITQMYELVYPKKTRYDQVPISKYIHSYAWMFRFENPRLLKTTGYSGFYNHNEFEESILKNKTMTKGYLEFIEKLVKRHFLEDEYKPGDKCLVYCSSIDMCDAVSKYLKKVLVKPGTAKKLDVRRYVGEDPYENLMEAEISVSTLKSAGTGHDIDSLTTVVLTHAISSSQSNIQGFGRLRNLQGRKMKFAYLVCQDVDKQLSYHHEKTELLRQRALTHEVLDHLRIIPCHERS